jgi:hypothetical protein
MFYSYAPLIALGIIGATYAVKIPIEVVSIITGAFIYLLIYAVP